MLRQNQMGYGFTLIELLIVVAIIGILAAIAVPNFLNAQVKAKVSKTEAEMQTFVTACEMYRLDHGKYFPHAGWPDSVIHVPWQNKYLTTPIAYVAAQPRDIFQDVVQPDESAWNLTYGMYHLENIFLPDYRETIKYVTDVLEERERDSFVIMKMTKKRTQERCENDGEG